MKEYKKPKQSKTKKHKHKKVQAYPHWQQIEFDNCVVDRGNIILTEKLFNARVISATRNHPYDNSSILRLKVKGSVNDYR